MSLISVFLKRLSLTKFGVLSKSWISYLGGAIEICLLISCFDLISLELIDDDEAFLRSLEEEVSILTLYIDFRANSRPELLRPPLEELSFEAGE